MISDWDYIRQSIDYYIHRVRSTTTLREGAILLCDIFTFVVSFIVRTCFCTTTTTTTTAGVFDNNNNNKDEANERLYRNRRGTSDQVLFNHIATTYSAFYVYFVVALSMITHHLWILHGISIFIVVTILSYVIKWVMYILDDNELVTNYKYLRGWIYLFLHEGEDILNGDKAWKVVSAYMMIQQAPTGMSYLQHVLRYKTRKLRKQFLMEIGGNRFDKLRISTLTAKWAASLNRSSNMSIGGNTKNTMFSDEEGYYEEIWQNDKNDIELVLQQNKKRKWI